MKKQPLLFFLTLVLFTSGCYSVAKVRATKYSIAQEKKPYDLLIVPGYPFVPEEGWTETIKSRLLWSVYLMKNGFAKKVMYSGSANYTPYQEGPLMALAAEKLGIPKEDILIEDKAEHTSENVYYGNLIAQEKGWTKIAVSTDIMQSLRLKEFQKYSRIDFDVIPMIPDSLTLSQPIPEIEYSTVFVEDFVPLRDRKKGLKFFHDSGGRHLPRGEKVKQKK